MPASESPVSWLPDGSPWNERFQDIYRSRGSDAQGGLAQARHVFLRGCGLLSADEPATWADAPDWRILETGFGLGLNFLAAWQAWAEDARRPQRLHYVGIEAWPPAAADLLRSVAYLPALQPYAQALAAVWQGLLPGFHRFTFAQGRVLLTLCVGDVGAMLRELAFEADSVFLDGFDPAHNPAMWDAHTLKAVARLSRPGTRAATWTVARSVRDHLTQAGFVVDKAPGLPPKRECLRARWAPHWERRRAALAPVPRWADSECSALVIGAGLSGASVAYSLAQRGWQVTVLERGDAPAAGASGLPAGVVAPHVSADDRALSRLSRSGVQAALARAAALLTEGTDWAASGVLERRLKDARDLPADWLAPDAAGHAWSRPAQADELAAAGLPATAPAHWHARAGWVRAPALVRAMLANLPTGRVRTAQAVAYLQRDANGRWQACSAAGEVLGEAAVAVVAAGFDSLALLRSAGGPGLPLNPLRGQLVFGPLPENAQALPRFPVNGLGNFIGHVPLDGRMGWVLGSTFERGCAEPRIDAGEVQLLQAKLQNLLPAGGDALREQFERAEVQAWASVRCTVPDRLPVVGALDANGLSGLMVCTGMGARGMTLAVLCGEVLAAELCGEPLPVPLSQARALAPQRLFKHLSAASCA
jgi:tRNA 5-methylaminomethyl-2-thiouridine biosynthesis bifunctional protein